MKRRSVLAKVQEGQCSINGRYAMNAVDLVEVNRSVSDPMESIYTGFCYGYLQGQKALRREMETKPTDLPKCRSEWRQAIYYELCHTKCNYVLRDLRVIADLFRRSTDNISYHTLTDIEREKVYIMQDLLRCEDMRCLEFIWSFMRRMMERREMKSKMLSVAGDGV